MGRRRVGDGTVEDDIILHLPDDGGMRYEWVAGRITSVAEPDRLHGRVVADLGVALANFVEANDLGQVYLNDTLFLLRRKPRVVRGPDVAYVTAARVGDPWAEGVWALAPDLAAEVRSRSQRWSVMRDKVADYLDAGVRLVWVVDPPTRSVLRYRHGIDVAKIGPDDMLDGEDVVPGFQVRVASLFPPHTWIRECEY